MTKDKQNTNGAKKKVSKLFYISAASTAAVVVAYIILDMVIGGGMVENSQLAGVAGLLSLGSIGVAGMCIASFVRKQQRALSVLCFVICVAIAFQAYFVYWFSGYGSGGY